MKKSVKRLTSVILALAICLVMCVGISAETQNICHHTSDFPAGTLCVGTAVKYYVAVFYQYSADAGTYHEWYSVQAEIYVDPYTTLGTQVGGPNNVQAFSRRVSSSLADFADFI